tara:strand:+ start:1081 stop:1899 length:819 start_codon:yes stop_codon:yes gene_type:complete
MKRARDESNDTTATTTTTTTATEFKSKPDKRQKKKKKKKRGICFDWAKGECKHGDKCIFLHDPAQKGKGVPATAYGAPWPDTRNPFGDVVARNYTELSLPRTDPLQSSSFVDSTTSSSSSSADTTQNSSSPMPIPCLDQYVHYHPNHLCIVGLAANHDALNAGAAITEIKYRTISNTNLLEMKMSGKKKHGSIKVKQETVLCDVVLENGVTYNIKAGIEGSLIEVNERIVKDPSLLLLDHRYRGYIGIIFQPKDNRLRRDLAACVAKGNLKK